MDKQSIKCMTRRSAAGAVTLLAAIGLGVPGAAQTTEPAPELIEDLVAANHILAAEGILVGFGHVSVRHDQNPDWFVISTALPPEFVTADDLLVMDLDGSVVDGRGNASPALYSERFIHAEIYRMRPDVDAVVHHHSPPMVAFGASAMPLKAVSNQARFIGVDGVPKFDISRIESAGVLVNSSALGAALTAALGAETAVLMSNHGAVVTGASIPMLVGRSIFLDINAELLLKAVALGEDVTYLHRRFASTTGTFGRPWQLWKQKHYWRDGP